MVKEFGADVTNLQHFERAVATRVLNHQLHTFNDANAFSTGTFLRPPCSVVSGELLGVQGVVSIARAASHSMIHTSAGDVVLYNDGGR